MKYWSFLAISCAAVLVGCEQKKGGAAGGGGMPPMQVVVAQAKRQPVAETVSLVGNVLANEAVEIKSEIEGNVESIKVQEGDRVEKGQLLIQLDDTKLASSLSEVEASFKLAKANYER